MSQVTVPFYKPFSVETSFCVFPSLVFHCYRYHFCDDQDAHVCYPQEVPKWFLKNFCGHRHTRSMPSEEPRLLGRRDFEPGGRKVIFLRVLGFLFTTAPCSGMSGATGVGEEKSCCCWVPSAWRREVEKESTAACAPLTPDLCCLLSEFCLQ